ncbi:hypothetical protein PR048_029378 [Dryococelus australis]|uniref:Uncharacterized protein n=1 Tax=Dryococelus australis TaxID=614101 RepID=A0ABQ9GFR6_9NEOP|nr:hypothetical protein PR048_029378 [Dryococelus australis]
MNMRNFPVYGQPLRLRYFELLRMPSNVAINSFLRPLFLKLNGAAVAERLACSSPIRAILAQSSAGTLRIFGCGNRYGRCRWSTGFLGGLPIPLPLLSGAAPYSPHFTSNGSSNPAGPGNFSDSFGDKLDFTILRALEHQLVVRWPLLQFHTRPGRMGFGSYTFLAVSLKAKPLQQKRHRLATASSVDDTLAGPDVSAIIISEGAGTRNELVVHVDDESCSSTDINFSALQVA